MESTSSVFSNRGIKYLFFVRLQKMFVENKIAQCANVIKTE